MTRAIAAGISFQLHTRGELSAERQESALDIAEAALTDAQCPLYSRRSIPVTPVTPVAPYIYELRLGFQCSGPDEVVELEGQVRDALADQITDHWRTS